MKIELDLTNKTIKIAEGCNLDKLMENLEMLLPNGKWKEFKLLTNVTINWIPSNPIVIQPYRTQPWTQPWYETTNPYVRIGTSTGPMLLTETKHHSSVLDSNPGVFTSNNINLKTSGIYQVEVKN